MPVFYHHPSQREGAERSAGANVSRVADVRDRSPRASTERSMTLYAGAHLRIGRFDCDDGDSAWRNTNVSGPWALLAFPGTAVEIQHEGRAAVVANTNCVMLYNAWQHYHRRLLDPRGDHCVFVSIAPTVLAEMIGTIDPAVHDRGARLFVGDHARIEARRALAASLLARHIADGDGVDAMFVEERTLALVAAIVRDAISHDRGAPRIPRHTALVQAIERELSLHFARACTLAEIARQVGCSPFHAARVFRAQLGITIHAYRHRLRLHAALHRMTDGDDLAAIALETGFATHSHFTEAVRRAFGAPPSHWRGRLDTRRLRAMTELLWAGGERARSRKRDPTALR
jgi:AraC-like DNA-binding protein